MPITLRLATPADAAQVQAIYAPYVTGTTISFELEPPTVEQLAQRISATLLFFPWLVAEESGRIVGYAYASPHRERLAYRWSVDVSVYVAPFHQRQGVGRALYTELFALLVRQGFYQAFAGITLPNAPSVGLHESLGFVPIGTYRNVGFKAGAWRDTGWWQKQLQPPSVLPPDPPTAWGELASRL
ncbi:arsinothricin resistance N-acetyltransferase ArsN1 family B [Armatimonas rosea]|uniref:Phosphinothricin acetyltransferase n=1 Tax=Armatimonas rosea TaxID=685828 RepID=A0A7W9W7K7_ARMRO|nr:arsinothricin resistance N-acetyltransferase ArsN1 family B [Armatimonas rosea]MBB6051195.1 phosphinothricin acetyltransferase [Armatimonas rosea]